MRNIGPYNEDEMNDEEKALLLVDEVAPQEEVKTRKGKKNADQD